MQLRKQNSTAGTEFNGLNIKSKNNDGNTWVIIDDHGPASTQRSKYVHYCSFTSGTPWIMLKIFSLTGAYL